MSIEQIPSVQWYKKFEDDEIVKIGSFTMIQDEELQYLMNYFFIHGNIAGTERFRAIAYSDPDYLSQIYVSDWSNFSDITGRGQYWQGWVRSTFHREHLKDGRTYYLAVEIDNYVRNADTFYIALKYDYDNSVYPKMSTQFAEYPLATRFYTWKEVDQ